MICFECGLPDPYDGDGDAIGSCRCPRCGVCGSAPGLCGCGVGTVDGDGSDGLEWDDDGSAEASRGRPVETVTVVGGVL